MRRHTPPLGGPLKVMGTVLAHVTLAPLPMVMVPLAPPESARGAAAAASKAAASPVTLPGRGGGARASAARSGSSPVSGAVQGVVWWGLAAAAAADGGSGSGGSGDSGGGTANLAADGSQRARGAGLRLHAERVACRRSRHIMRRLLAKLTLHGARGQQQDQRRCSQRCASCAAALVLRRAPARRPPGGRHARVIDDLVCCLSVVASTAISTGGASREAEVPSDLEPVGLRSISRTGVSKRPVACKRLVVDCLGEPPGRGNSAARHDRRHCAATLADAFSRQLQTRPLSNPGSDRSRAGCPRALIHPIPLPARRLPKHHPTASSITLQRRAAAAHRCAPQNTQTR